jgi:hypothetical protein
MRRDHNGDASIVCKRRQQAHDPMLRIESDC